MTYLKQQRESKKMTIREVCEAAKISNSMYSMIENEKRRPSVETAKKIAAVLGFSWVRFFEDEGEEKGA